ncbi:hypothetical protein C483_07372 [Natrialba hulunbeirensis JCM 10989]|uniref:Uncharacterized protein n=1 Tax=Natrialba hulunbeirensis JCM 10989 TaxID=1227493 RepID=M0A2C0_9EURY|nr:hypothetical protein [Natrialba hulunbeirensis]ELY92769.1 hypothetical protein C483_07372 [Natrialba hulunbeirensis JCM 10989]
MVLRCSLLGHDYGESDVEREREERGSEVVVTVQEYEECVRCGDRHVISENTEVTSLSAVSATETEPDTTDTAAPDSKTTPTPDPDLSHDDVSTPPDDSPTHATADSSTTEIDETDGVTDDGMIIDDEPDAAAVESGPEPGRGDADVGGDSGDGDDGGSEYGEHGEHGKHREHRDHSDHSDEFDVPTDEDGNPVTDDGEILEDEPADDHTDRERDREHGEWPDSDDVGPPVDDAESEHDGWPDAGEQADDDAVVLEHDSTAYEDESAVDARTATVDSTEHTQFDGMEDTDDGHQQPTAAAGESTANWASGSEASGDSSSSVDAGADTAPEAETTEAGSGIERIGDAPTPGDADHPGEDVPSEFYCPRCEFVVTSDRGSLRAGDICPDCRKGYLGERARQ